MLGHPHRCVGHSGTALLELVVMLPVLLLITFGTIEGGAAIVSADRVAGAAAQGARIGAVSGSRGDADRDILVAVQAALPDGELARLDRVVVFNPAGPDGAVPAGCIRAMGDTSDQGVAGKCNSYSGPTVRSVAASSMIGFGGVGASRDGFWSPSARRDTLAAGPDFIGVWIRSVHTGVLGLVFRDVVVTRTSVVRIQPDLAG